MRRFDAIQEATGASRAILVARLRGLTQAGVLERVEYREPGARTRHEYRLTPAGRELQPVLTALMQWGDKHLASPAGPPLTVTHTDCGATVRATLRCEHGHVLPTPAGISPSTTTENRSGTIAAPESAQRAAWVPGSRWTVGATPWLVSAIDWSERRCPMCHCTLDFGT
ncbi:putative HTH-type transcriptional regulator [Nocardia seriolae]|uniref:HTH-type transcriptional regulator n=1 Tax=Nocardia seriolae TaxID=37332 RepID=A0ABC8ANX8_9NOCA|nr:helix-turn-helix domain-containing protein [Nocardia seriolae]APA95903.1 putative HTH-type transcriptional regulator [Nocardia seriolae]